MKTVLYAISALALAATSAHAANDGFKVQSEMLAVTRGDDVGADRKSPAAYPLANVRLERQRVADPIQERVTMEREAPALTPKSDAWMQRDNQDTVYGD